MDVGEGREQDAEASVRTSFKFFYGGKGQLSISDGGHSVRPFPRIPIPSIHSELLHLLLHWYSDAQCHIPSRRAQPSLTALCNLKIQKIFLRLRALPGTTVNRRYRTRTYASLYQDVLMSREGGKPLATTPLTSLAHVSHLPPKPAVSSQRYSRYNRLSCESGGIGRRAGFRFLWGNP